MVLLGAPVLSAPGHGAVSVPMSQITPHPPCNAVFRASENAAAAPDPRQPHPQCAARLPPGCRGSIPPGHLVLGHRLGDICQGG
ncbi:unnamed protein product [Natator depressus]